MRRSRVCTSCGCDFGRASPQRERWYGLLAVTCPGCARVHPAAAARKGRKAFRAWARLVISIGVTVGVALVVVFVTVFHEREFADYHLDLRSLLRPGVSTPLDKRIEFYTRGALVTDWAILIVVRCGVGFLAGMWCVMFSRRVRLPIGLLIIWIIVAYAGTVGSLIDHLPLASIGRHSDPWGQLSLRLYDTVLPTGITLAFGLPASLFRRWVPAAGDRLRSEAFIRRLRRARTRRSA